MAGTLFVVATPIGNLEDITLRALRVLREAHLVAAEDTRRTARLLAHHGIAAPTISFHQHNARERIPGLLARLEAGERVALVTDAGTPGVSDPGPELVRACIEQGIRVEPIPGASAAVTAAVASGFPLVPLTILGFPPPRSKSRDAWLLAAAEIRHTWVFFEAPHRIAATLRTAARLLGNRHITVGRELTKIHEEVLHGSATDVIGQLTELRGEFTVVVGPVTSEAPRPAPPADEDLLAEFGQITERGASGRREAVTALARKHGISSRDVYARIERAKTSVE